MVCWLALDSLPIKSPTLVGDGGGFKAGYVGMSAVLGTSVTAMDVVSKLLFGGFWSAVLLAWFGPAGARIHFGFALNK